MKKQAEIVVEYLYQFSRCGKAKLTHDDENVPGSAAILAAVDDSMQAGMPALPGVVFGAD